VDEAALLGLLESVRSGELHLDDAVAVLRRLPFADLGFARVDHHRGLRQGVPEAVYGPGKDPAHLAAIVGELLDAGAAPVIATRVSDEQAAAALGAHPDGVRHGATLVWRPAAPRPERVVVCTAGTADLPVADECAAVLEAHGVEPIRITDAGVAGIHRLLAEADVLAGADAIVVVAGMEGALASVVGGLTGAPVVAVPTSVGYGVSEGGFAALLTMLATCVPGIGVVNIDNGFGAACLADRINKLAVKIR
jgi:NCAIR mutase (PurE)-related protein